MEPQSLEYSQARGYNLGIAREISLEAACVYNQLAFWQSVKGEGKWFYKPYEEMTSELPLSERTLRRVYTLLKDKGYVEVKVSKVEGAPKLHFRVLRKFSMDTAKMTDSMDTAKMTETYKNNKTPINNITDSATAQKVGAVYELYLKQFKMPLYSGEATSFQEQLDKARKRYKLTDRRRKAIETRLKDAGFNMLCAAIVGFSKESWYTGDNNRGWTADLEMFICRNYENVEKGANKYEQQKQTKHTNDPWASL